MSVFSRTFASTPPSHDGDDLESRMLAEAVRFLEESQGTPLNEPEADTQARETEGSFEHRIIQRARHLSVSSELRRAQAQLRRMLLITTIGAGVVALMAGIAAGRTALGAGEDANVFWVLGGLLSLPTLTLILWLVLLFSHPSVPTGGTLGWGVLALAQRLDRWLHQGISTWAATRAGVSVLGSSAMGRWWLSALSHGLWAVFLCGCILMLVAVLALRQYSFYWETTILSEDSYVLLTRGLAWLPEQLGFPTPAIEDITASRWQGEGQPPRQASGPWSGFLLGSLVVYGLIPRILMLALSLVASRREGRRYRLDPSLPGFERLRPRLMPVASSLGVVDPDPGPTALLPAPTTEVLDGGGPPAMVGLEISTPSSGWPPNTGETQWWDLGIINNREDRRRVLEALKSARQPPGILLVVCSLTTTPDRGIGNFLRRLGQESGAPLGLVLTDGQRMRKRGHHEQLSQRIRDWQALATGIGIEEDLVATVDLEHLTPASQVVLEGLAGNEMSSPGGLPLDEAFTLIVEHCCGWTSAPEPAQQAALHQEILQCFHRRQRPLPDFFTLSGDPAKLSTELRHGARRLADLLPSRLRASPRWLACGAMGGALGCVAAAGLLTPLAITGLPLWAGLGAAVAFAVQPSGDPSPAADPPQQDLGEAVGAAALFAVILDLQGLPEETISEILDELFDDHPPTLADGNAAETWLGQIRQRLVTLRAESVS